MFFIYGLHLEGDDEIRYVGSTCNPEARYFQHLYGHDKGNPPKNQWVASNSARVKMKIIHSNVSEKDRRRIEQETINECKKNRYRLFNHRGATRNAANAHDVTWWLDHIEGKDS